MSGVFKPSKKMITLYLIYLLLIILLPMLARSTVVIWIVYL